MGFMVIKPKEGRFAYSPRGMFSKLFPGSVVYEPKGNLPLPVSQVFKVSLVQFVGQLLFPQC